MKTILVLVLWACLLTGAKTCEHVSNDAGYFPCDKYFLFIVNKGYDITVEQFAAQKNFILNYLFNTSQWEGFNPVPWNHPERIALIAYDKTPTVFDFGSFSAMNQVYSNISILTQTTYTALLNQALFAAARLRLNCSVDVYTYLFTSTNDIIDISRALNYAPTLLNCGRSILVGMNYADMGSLRQLNFPVNIYWPQGPPVPPTPSSDWMTQFIFKDCTTISYPCLNKVMFVVNQCGDPSFFSLQQYFLSYELMTPYWTNPERFAYLRYYNEDEVPYTALNDFGTFSTMDDLRAIINGTTSMACQTTEVTPYMTLLKFIKETYAMSPPYYVDFHVVLFISNDATDEGLKDAAIWAASIPNLTAVVEGSTSLDSVNRWITQDVISWPSQTSTPPGNWYENFMVSIGCGKLPPMTGAPITQATGLQTQQISETPGPTVTYW